MTGCSRSSTIFFSIRVEDPVPKIVISTPRLLKWQIWIRKSPQLEFRLTTLTSWTSIDANFGVLSSIASDNLFPFPSNELPKFGILFSVSRIFFYHFSTLEIVFSTSAMGNLPFVDVIVKFFIVLNRKLSEV